MSELLLPPEHRYAKIMKEKLNEDGSELSILNLSYSPCYARDFPNVLLMDGERILEAEPNWLHTPRF
jgi:NADH-quinone oxidoreductase subunit D